MSQCHLDKNHTRRGAKLLMLANDVSLRRRMFPYARGPQCAR